MTLAEDCSPGGPVLPDFRAVDARLQAIWREFRIAGESFDPQVDALGAELEALRGKGDRISKEDLATKTALARALSLVASCQTLGLKPGASLAEMRRALDWTPLRSVTPATLVQRQNAVSVAERFLGQVADPLAQVQGTSRSATTASSLTQAAQVVPSAQGPPPTALHATSAPSTGHLPSPPPSPQPKSPPPGISNPASVDGSGTLAPLLAPPYAQFAPHPIGVSTGGKEDSARRRTRSKMLKLGVGFAVAAIVAALLIPPVLSGALPFVSNSFSFAIGKDLPGDAYFQVCQPVPLNLPDGASVQFTWTLQDPNNGDTTTFGINDSQENVAYSVLTSTHGTGSFTSNGDHYGVCAAWAYNSAGVDLIEFTGSFSVPY